MKYLSAKDISENYSISIKSARIIIAEIKDQISGGRYPEKSILEGCGVRVNQDVITDYLFHRRALRDPIARQYVERYET